MLNSILMIVFLIHAVAFGTLYAKRRRPRYLALVGTFSSLVLMTLSRQSPVQIHLWQQYAVHPSLLFRALALLFTTVAVILLIRDKHRP